MKIYSDDRLTDEIVQILDLGIVQAGDTKEYTYYVYNDTNAELIDIAFSIDNAEVEILEFPTKLQSKEKGALRIKYSPSVNIKKGLRTSLKTKGVEIYS